MAIPPNQAIRHETTRSAVRRVCGRPRGGWIVVCVVLLCGHPASATTSKAGEGAGRSDARENESQGWWVRAGEREIRHDAEGRRTVRHGDLIYDDEQPQAGGLLTTSDGVRYRTTADGTIEMLVGGTGLRLRTEVDAPQAGAGLDRCWQAWGDWLRGDAGRASKSEDSLSLERLGPWVFAAMDLLLRICAAMVLLRVVCFWIDVSYSKSIVLRYAVVLTLVAESVVRWIPGALWAG